MTTRRLVHRADGDMTLRCVALAATAVVLAVPAAALGSTAPDRFVVTDPSGDAGGLNDRGEGVVTDVRGPVSFATADLTRMAFTARRDSAQQATGFSVHFTSVGGPHPATDLGGSSMTYAVVMQPTPDCRLSITYTAVGEFPGQAELRTGNGCSTPGRSFALASSAWGTSVRVDVPYGVGPDALRPGEDLDQLFAYSSDGTVMYDTIHPRAGYTLPR